jgi:TAG lipase/steryl ester hydrolase/phospholipase A2/LPA acyltransferase
MSTMSRKYEIALAEATSYDEWYKAALVLDHLDGGEKWREEPESPDYDFKLLASRVKLLRQLRRRKDLDQLIFRLREELHGNLGNMANPALYQHSRVGTKKLVNAYLDEVCAALTLLCDSDVESLPRPAASAVPRCC